MTRYEKITSSIDDAAEELCEAFEQLECENCPASEYCHKGHNGMKDWLLKGVENDKNRKMVR